MLSISALAARFILIALFIVPIFELKATTTVLPSISKFVSAYAERKRIMFILRFKI